MSTTHSVCNTGKESSEHGQSLGMARGCAAVSFLSLSLETSSTFLFRAQVSNSVGFLYTSHHPVGF